ncbi:replication/maintenance protein RepL [Photobacterium leiognathi]|uniref:replication/maintenance protein RepL n=1 Tax=Photobacterium leiognathi TaxID=553611 RepID=UPI00273913DE|nr:replication/maintenance protein RepL [Photobacterium leiognathi]
MALDKTLYTATETVTDLSTGEVVSLVEKKTVRHSKEPPFIKLYVDDVIRLYGLPKGESRILFELIKRMNYQGEIVINATIKRDIASILGVGGSKPEQIISNSMNKLVKSDILFRKGTGVYITNPHIFAKGDWDDIQELRNSYIEMKIKYSSKGREIETTIHNQ